MHHLLALDYTQLWQTKGLVSTAWGTAGCVPPLVTQHPWRFSNAFRLPMGRYRRFRLVSSEAFIEEGYLYIWQEKPFLKDSLFAQFLRGLWEHNPRIRTLSPPISIPSSLHSVVVGVYSAPRSLC